MHYSVESCYYPLSYSVQMFMEMLTIMDSPLSRVKVISCTQNIANYEELQVSASINLAAFHIS